MGSLTGYRTFVIAPLSAVPLDEAIIDPSQPNYGLKREWGLFPVRKVDFHINLDDVDLNKESVMDTVTRVMGRHGLGVWLLVSI
jgi:phosphatidylinositol glycan class Z